jgi:hypothetical protein
MKESKKTGLLVTGSVRTAGVTFYIKNGQTIVRSARTNQPRRNTRAQFDARMRMRHTTALWQVIRGASPLFSGGKSTYARFASLANGLQTVYLPNRGPLVGATLLLPNMPVSDGTMPAMGQELTEVDGIPTLLTNLKANEMERGEVLRLYTFRQHTEGRTPRVSVEFRDMKPREMVKVNDCLALQGDEFADTMAGWALVRVAGLRWSSQRILTRCTYYERFTTDEAMEAAAASYGGLTK